MITDLNKIADEWTYRVGVIDYEDEKHLYHLNNILMENVWSHTEIDELLQNLNEEVDFDTKDIPLLRNLGILNSVPDEDLSDIINDKVNLSGVSCGRGSGTTAFQDIQNYDLKALEKIIKKGDKFFITYAGTEKKLRNVKDSHILQTMRYMELLKELKKSGNKKEIVI